MVARARRAGDVGHLGRRRRRRRDRARAPRAPRELMPRAPFLLPGIGAQGGRVEDLAPAFAPGRAGGLVTASRWIARAHETARRRTPGRGGARRGRAPARAAHGRCRDAPAASPDVSCSGADAFSRPARVLAPLALLVCRGGGAARRPEHAGGRPGGSPSSATDGRRRRPRPPARRRCSTRKTYSVQAGDTLGAIAERRASRSTSSLELNPDVDPQSLRAGQRHAPARVIRAGARRGRPARHCLVAPSVAQARSAPPRARRRRRSSSRPSTGDVSSSATPRRRASIASTTKLMTALLTLERAALDDVLTARRTTPAPVESRRAAARASA